MAELAYDAGGAGATHRPRHLMLPHREEEDDTEADNKCAPLNGAIRPVGSGKKSVHRRHHEHREAQEVYAMPQLSRKLPNCPGRGLDRDQQVGAEDSPRDSVRPPTRRERDEQLLEVESHERVEPNRTDMDDDEHDREGAEVSVQVEDPCG